MGALPFSLRLATTADTAALKALMDGAIAHLLPPFLNPEQVAASFAVMGLDTQLLHDGTYFAVEHDRQLIGSGGWSRGDPLFGGVHSAGRSAALLEPGRDAARIRAMYTHPDFTRRGVGRAVLVHCERAALAEGFTSAELAATLAGEPLYRACGYDEIQR